MRKNVVQQPSSTLMRGIKYEENGKGNGVGPVAYPECAGKN